MYKIQTIECRKERLKEWLIAGKKPNAIKKKKKKLLEIYENYKIKTMIYKKC